ncbi:hypothetical protein BDN71DRAFT_1031937 [Pleurotus eryngii]|uniref:Uncharacterized protein n=1 Tax=Pleurotus eryngii TaxID=5323 RepID=A0A9P6A9E2_PLEER|nr:hypothetical protein BDN71DRAFT_1031937 [Pleurotus eryngii]
MIYKTTKFGIRKYSDTANDQSRERKVMLAELWHRCDNTICSSAILLPSSFMGGTATAMLSTLVVVKASMPDDTRMVVVEKFESLVWLQSSRRWSYSSAPLLTLWMCLGAATLKYVHGRGNSAQRNYFVGATLSCWDCGMRRRAILRILAATVPVERDEAGASVERISGQQGSSPLSTQSFALDGERRYLPCALSKSSLISGSCTRGLDKGERIETFVVHNVVLNDQHGGHNHLPQDIKGGHSSLLPLRHGRFHHHQSRGRHRHRSSC